MKNENGTLWKKKPHAHRIQVADHQKDGENVRSPPQEKKKKDDKIACLNVNRIRRLSKLLSSRRVNCLENTLISSFWKV